MPATKLSEPSIGRWSPYTEIGSKVRNRFGLLALLGISLIVICTALSDFEIARPWMITVAALPCSLLYPQLKEWLIKRSAYQTVKTMNKGLCVNLRFISNGSDPSEDTGVLWFEGRRMNFKGARCEFQFDVSRFHFYDHYVDGVSTPYRLRALDVGGKDLAIVFGGTVGGNLIGSYSDRIEEALTQAPDTETPEVLPPTGGSLLGWCPATGLFAGICTGLAVLCFLATVWVKAFHLTNEFFFAGPFGIFGYGIFALVSYLDIKRYRKAEVTIL